MVVCGGLVCIKLRGPNTGSSLAAATSGKESDVHEQALHIR